MKPEQKQKQKPKPLTKKEKEIVEKFKSGLGIYDLNTGMFATQLEDIIRRALLAIRRRDKRNGECVWKWLEQGYYSTSCGKAYELYFGELEENAFKYCPFCGKEIDV